TAAEIRGGGGAQPQPRCRGEPGQRGVGDVRNAGEHRGSISIADGHGATDAHLYGDPNDAAIPTLLRSRFHGDKFDALNHLLALISQGVDVAHLSPQAVKNVVAQSLELKKLVSSTALPAPLRREVLLPRLDLIAESYTRSSVWPQQLWTGNASRITSMWAAIASKLFLEDSRTFDE
uniref:Uncharacterized protein n=1 Tax=Triticum urartu TaxID=4572 RepID=A0A8R7QJK6_TRIUA